MTAVNTLDSLTPDQIGEPADQRHFVTHPTPEQRENCKRWLARLRKANLDGTVQSTCWLRSRTPDGVDCFCAIGLALDEYDSSVWRDGNLDTVTGHRVVRWCGCSRKQAAILPDDDHFRQIFGLPNSPDVIVTGDKCRFGDRIMAVSKMNDLGFTFGEIADALERSYPANFAD